jgi:hypothetical protein
MDELLVFLRRLDDASHHYMLGSYRESVLVHLTARPNERWEVEFFPDGTVELERFVSDGDVERADPVALLDSLLAD